MSTRHCGRRQPVLRPELQPLSCRDQQRTHHAMQALFDSYLRWKPVPSSAGVATLVSAQNPAYACSTNREGRSTQKSQPIKAISRQQPQPLWQMQPMLAGRSSAADRRHQFANGRSGFVGIVEVANTGTGINLTCHECDEIVDTGHRLLVGLLPRPTIRNRRRRICSIRCTTFPRLPSPKITTGRSTTSERVSLACCQAAKY